LELLWDEQTANRLISNKGLNKQTVLKRQVQNKYMLKRPKLWASEGFFPEGYQ